MDGDYETPRNALRHSRLRLGRARKRFVELGKEITAHVQANSPRLDRRFDAPTGWTSYCLGSQGQPPRRFADGAGLVCEDLRVALDLLIGGLRAQSQSEPSRFPICLTVDDYLGPVPASGQRERLLQGLASPDLALIDSLQPYHRVNPAKHPLAQLQEMFVCYTRSELNGTLILSESPSAQFEELESGSVTRAETRQAEPEVVVRDGLEALAYKVWPDPTARLKVDLSLRFDLRFDPPGLTMSDLDRIRARVEETVRSFDTRLASAA